MHDVKGSRFAQPEYHSCIVSASCNRRAVQKPVIRFYHPTRISAVGLVSILIGDEGVQSSQLTGWGESEDGTGSQVAGAAQRRGAIELAVRRLDHGNRRVAIRAKRHLRLRWTADRAGECKQLMDCLRIGDGRQ